MTQKFHPGIPPREMGAVVTKGQAGMSTALFSVTASKCNLPELPFSYLQDEANPPEDYWKDYVR